MKFFLPISGFYERSSDVTICCNATTQFRDYNHVKSLQYHAQCFCEVFKQAKTRKKNLLFLSVNDEFDRMLSNGEHFGLSNMHVKDKSQNKKSNNSERKATRKQHRIHWKQWKLFFYSTKFDILLLNGLITISNISPKINCSHKASITLFISNTNLHSCSERKTPLIMTSVLHFRVNKNARNKQNNPREKNKIGIWKCLPKKQARKGGEFVHMTFLSYSNICFTKKKLCRYGKNVTKKFMPKNNKPKIPHCR